MAEHDRPPVGSVAEEASRLLDALGGWAGSASAAYAASAPHDDPPHDDAPHDREPHEPARTETADGAHREDGADERADGSPLHGASRCASCGAENGVGQAVTCQLCPVCQGIALVRSVRPETVDRLADLAGAIAATLRDLADQRRAGGQSTGARPGSGASSSTRVQDIRIDTDDESAETP